MHRHHYIIKMFIALCIAGEASADNQFGTQETDLLNTLSAIARYSPLEGAYSHGSIGATFGVGTHSYNDVPASSLQQHHMHMDDSDDKQDMRASHMYIVKGLALPIDVGVSLGATQDDQISIVGGHIQWTVFEGFRVPAVAFRAAHKRLFGLNDAEVSATRVDVVVGTNLMNFLTVYGFTGMQRNDVTLNSAAYFQYGLTAQPENLDYRKVWLSKAHAIGIRALVIPPLLALTAELQLDSATGQSVAAKISLDI